MPQAASKRIAVITGASSGMGREFAIQIDALNEVDELWLIARNESALKEVAALLKAPARCMAADLGDAAALDYLKAELDCADVIVAYVVNAAGFGKFGTWREVPDAAARGMVDVNCRAVVTLTRACLPHMRRGSRVIELASCAAFVSLPSMNVYAASKAFVLSYTRALRWELRGTGITATAVCPAWVKTGFEKTARAVDDANASANSATDKRTTPNASNSATGERVASNVPGGWTGVKHLPFQQKASTVVRRALLLNRLHFAVATCGVPAFLLRIAGKFLPRCITMAGWEALRRI